MVTYNTVPLSEDARLDEPKAPQNRMLALVAAVCFASACAGASVPRNGKSHVKRANTAKKLKL